MNLKGIIKAVYPQTDKNGNQRTFATKDGETFECFNVELHNTLYLENGSTYTDSFLLEYNRKQEQGQAAPFGDLVASGAVVECRVAFTISEWQNRKFQTSRLYQVTRKEA